MQVNSFAMAKTRFFQKRSKRRRGFHPDGMFMKGREPYEPSVLAGPHQNNDHRTNVMSNDLRPPIRRPCV